jgi:hypothetical protein
MSKKSDELKAKIQQALNEAGLIAVQIEHLTAKGKMIAQQVMQMDMEITKLEEGAKEAKAEEAKDEPAVKAAD